MTASRVLPGNDAAPRLEYEGAALTAVDEGLDIVERYYPGRPVEAKVRFFLEESLARRP